MGAGQIELRDLGAQKDSKRRSDLDPRGSGRWTDAWRRWKASLGGCCRSVDAEARGGLWTGGCRIIEPLLRRLEMDGL